MILSTSSGGIIIAVVAERVKCCPVIACRRLVPTSMKTTLGKFVWLGVLAVSTVAAAVAPDNQVVIDSLRKQPQYEWRFPTFDAAEDIVDQWVENGRQFLTRNGKTCTYLNI
jgi:hypothetical protein